MKVMSPGPASSMDRTPFMRAEPSPSSRAPVISASSCNLFSKPTAPLLELFVMPLYDLVRKLGLRRGVNYPPGGYLEDVGITLLLGYLPHHVPQFLYDLGLLLDLLLVEPVVIFHELAL